MNNLTELNAFVASAINAFFAALDDKKIDLSDLGKFLDPILKAAPAIQDIGLVGSENAALSIPQRNAVNQDFLRSMPMVEESIADDITRIQGGIWAAYRVGYNLGRAKLIDQIKKGEIDISDLVDSE